MISLFLKMFDLIEHQISQMFAAELLLSFEKEYLSVGVANSMELLVGDNYFVECLMEAEVGD